MAENPKKIQVITLMPHIRKRAHMYIGSVDEGGITYLFHALLRWAEQNAESLVVVSESDSNYIVVSHDGPGIPIEKHSKVDKTILELIMTTLGTGSHSDLDFFPVINALSDYMLVETAHDDVRYEQTFSAGIAQGPLSKGLHPGRLTTITFRPDPQIFGEASLKRETAIEMVEEAKKRNSKLSFTFI